MLFHDTTLARRTSLTGLLCLLALVLFVTDVSAQDGVPPIPPAIPSTTQLNPRGADIVEPMSVYRTTVHRDGRRDSTYLGVAKIPDPRRGEHGAFVRMDQNTGTMIRIADAWIITDNGLKRIVEFDPRASEDLLVFYPGPHDEVVSRQGASPVIREVGERIVFSMSDLYDSATRNPLSGVDAATDAGPRTALLTMRSTYPRGEAVHLGVDLVPMERPHYTSVRIVRQDTTRFYVPAPERFIERVVVRPQQIALIVAVEAGYGPRYVHTRVPASRGPFTARGSADAFYVDGYARLERPTHRWNVHVFGMTSLVESDVTDISHHQVALLADLRFEYGVHRFLAIHAAGRLADKPYQEFTWTSADYSGSLLIGAGIRAADHRGLETRRLEIVAGPRMGENRVIEVYRAGDRARGLGGEIAIKGRRADLSLLGAEVHLTGLATGYAIAGRGNRDAGFKEHGMRLEADVRVGQELGFLFAYGALRGLARREKAEYPGGDEYFMNDALVAPAVGIEMRF